MQRLKRWAIKKLAYGLLPILIKEEDILTFDRNGKPLIGRKPIDNERLERLQADARLISKMDLWQLINVYTKEFSATLLFEKSQTLTDLIVAKSVLYTLNVQTEIINKVKDCKIE